MHLAFVTAMVVAALPPDPNAPPLAGKVPIEGRWFASNTIHGTGHGPDVFSIVHATPSGVDLAFTSTTIRANSYAWSDADTLIVLEGFEPPMKLHWFDAGKPAQSVEVPAAAWPPGATIFWPALGTLADGSAVLVNCAELTKNPSKCNHASVLQVTREGVVTSAKKPPRAVRWPSNEGLRPKPVKRPEGYTATVTKVDIDDQSIKGVACTSPVSSSTWPSANTVNWEFMVRPTKVTWIDDDPPIFEISGTATSPIGERGAASAVFLACSAEPIQHYRVLGNGLWLSGEDVLAGHTVATTYWTLWSNGQALARIQGDAHEVVMAPY